MDAFWISAQISMTPCLCQLSLPSVPPLHPICLINWSEILASKPCPGGSIEIYLPWIRNWDPETRTTSTYSGAQEMQPEELFKGYILIACAKRGNGKTVSAKQGKMCRGGERESRKKIPWFFAPSGAVTNFSQILQPSSNKFLIKNISWASLSWFL